MAFKASNVRKRKPPEPFAKGKAIGPSAALRIWYQNQMDVAAAAMIADYQRAIEASLRRDEVKTFFAMDATASSVFKDMMTKLDVKWATFFTEFAKNLSKEFVAKSDESAKAAVHYSLSAAGLKHPVMTYNEAVNNTLNSAQTFNHTLITNIQKEVHERLYKSIMLSLTSPNPEEQGASGIQNALKEVGGFSKKRIKLIARDQTAKVNSALADERMEQNGVEYFEWMHSSAGKVPRKTHIEKNGKVFKLDDPRLWEGPKADQGPPGWAINCRCRRKPLIGYRPSGD